MDHFIYVIAPDQSDVGLVKLGISNDPEQRLKNLQTGSPHRLVIHHTEAVDQSKVKILERLLHRDLHQLRRRGEWFELSVQEAINHVIFTVIRYESHIDKPIPGMKAKDFRQIGA